MSSCQSDTATDNIPDVGVAPLNLLSCPNCNNRNNVSRSQHDTLTWAVAMACLKCHGQWWICTICPKVRSHIMDTRMLNRHDKSKHLDIFGCIQDSKESLSDSGMESQQSLSDIGMDCDDNAPHSNDSHKLDIRQATTRAATFNFENTCSSIFFEKDYKDEDMAGLKYLISWSHCHLEFEEIPNDELSFQMIFGHLVSTLSRSQRTTLGLVMKKAIELSERRKELVTSVLTSSERIRSHYVSGKFALLRNLPRPVVKCHNAHGYVSIRECVADLLAHGVELDVISTENCTSNNSTVHCISQSKRAREIAGRAKALFPGLKVVVLYCNEWSDGFEPTYSIKNNRGSTWLKTVTISPPHGKIHSLQNTYPIAIGKSKSKHEGIEKRFAAELMGLSNGTENWFYSKAAKGNVCVHLELFCSLQDQPERRHANYVMLGGGTFTARFGYAGDFASVASGIPSCDDCLQAMISGAMDTSTIFCNKCVNWNLDVESGLLDFPPPKDYPVLDLPPGCNLLRPMRITYDTMKTAVMKAHDKVVTKDWSVLNGKSYLWVNGLNREAITAIMDRAIRCSIFDDLQADHLNKEEEYEAVMRDKSRHPELYSVWQFPSFWVRGTSMSQHIDVVMHILFLGVIKATLKRLEEWMHSRGIADRFRNSAKGVLQGIKKLNLTWCRALPYQGGNFTGWVSENYLALARLLPWFYGTRMENMATGVEPIVYVDPLTPPSVWTAKINTAWLSNRGLSTKGLAKELTERVQQEMLQEGGPPQIIPPAPWGPPTEVTDVVHSLYKMTSYLMSKEVTASTIEIVSCRIKLFLSAFHRMDATLRRKKKKPSWLSSYNFLCLLNLPSVIAEFGPLPNLWEGGGQGERVLSIVKPMMRGYRPQWQKHVLTNLLDKMALNRLMAQLVNDKGDAEDNFEVDETEDDTEVIRGMDYHCYPSSGALRAAARYCTAISAVHLVDGRFAVIVRKKHCGHAQHLLSVSVVELDVEQCGLAYFKLLFLEDDSITPLVPGSIKSACLMLPLLTSTGYPELGTENVSYAIINKDWLTYSSQRVFKYAADLNI